MARLKELGEGNRFSIYLVYEEKPQPGTFIHPSFTDVRREIMPLGKIVPPDEKNSVASPVMYHRTHELKIQDRMSAEPVDILRKLPPTWQVVTIQYVDAHLAILGNYGQDMDPDVLAQKLPVLHRIGSKKLALPIYKVRTQGSSIDEAAEQIIYTLGMCFALSSRGKDPGEARNRAIRYLKQTFSGDLVTYLA